MISTLTLLLIVSAWAVVVVVPALSRWRSAQQVSSVARFRDQLHVLEKQCSGTSINFSFTVTKTQEYALVTRSYSPTGSPHHMSPMCYRRRRRTFSSLTALSLLSIIAVPATGMLGIVSLALSLVLLGSYVTILRRSKLKAVEASRHVLDVPNARVLEYS